MTEGFQLWCLNPCFNGRYSQREDLTPFESMGLVLILVLMEDTLRASKGQNRKPRECLNPCFNGRYSQSF